MKKIISLIFIFLFTACVGYQVMTPDERKQELNILGQNIGRYVIVKHPELKDKALNYADKILEAKTALEANNIFQLAYDYYQEKYPEEVLLVSALQQFLHLSGIELIPDVGVNLETVEMEYVYSFTEGFKKALES